MNPKVDFYFDKAVQWREELLRMRQLPLDCGLDEQLKWGSPCYTCGGSNVVLIHAFKDYCAFLFFKGALMTDPDGILIQQTKNVQAARQIRFTGLKDVQRKSRSVKAYIYEAIEIEKKGLKVQLKKTSEFSVPAELTDKLGKNAALKKAFDSLTPGRQRGYYLYFSQPKRTETRLARIQKYTKHILAAKA